MLERPAQLLMHLVLALALLPIGAPALAVDCQASACPPTCRCLPVAEPASCCAPAEPSDPGCSDCTCHLRAASSTPYAPAPQQSETRDPQRPLLARLAPLQDESLHHDADAVSLCCLVAMPAQAPPGSSFLQQWRC